MTAQEISIIRILGFGDSLTSGYPGYDPNFRRGNEKSQYGYWLIKSAEKEGWTTLKFENKGVPGELVRRMYDRLVRLLDKKSYDIVIILGGTNDIGLGYDPHHIFEALKKLWKRTTESEAKVVGCTIPPIELMHPFIQEAQKKLNHFILTESTSKKEVIGVDLFSTLADSEGFLKPKFDCGDGLHLSVEGYKQMGEFIWRKGVRPLLESNFTHLRNINENT